MLWFRAKCSHPLSAPSSSWKFASDLCVTVQEYTYAMCSLISVASSGSLLLSLSTLFPGTQAAQGLSRFSYLIHPSVCKLSCHKWVAHSLQKTSQLHCGVQSGQGSVEKPMLIYPTLNVGCASGNSLVARYRLAKKMDMISPLLVHIMWRLLRELMCAEQREDLDSSALLVNPLLPSDHCGNPQSPSGLPW